MKRAGIYLLTIGLFWGMINGTSCSEPSKKQGSDSLSGQILSTQPTLSLVDSLRQLFIAKSEYLTDGFDFPVGKPDAKGYYNAQPFGNNMHLGDDWNAVTGGNTDLGDPIFAIGNGLVRTTHNYGGGWGQVIWLIHCMDSSEHRPSFVTSLYAHCDTILVSQGDWVRKGQQIGTIGNANGQYLAHLHLEIRDSLELPLGGGYGGKQGYLNPSTFIERHRFK